MSFARAARCHLHGNGFYVRANRIVMQTRQDSVLGIESSTIAANADPRLLTTL
jgi:hypothetical protein